MPPTTKKLAQTEAGLAGSPARPIKTKVWDGPIELLRGGGDQIKELLDVLPAAAYTCDAEGLITYFNDHAVRLWGRAPKLRDVADRYCGSFKLFTCDGEPIAHDRCWMAMALHGQCDYLGQEIVIERPDGTRATAMVHARPLRDHAGRVTGAVNILVDITDRRAAEELLRKSEARERAKAAELQAIMEAVPAVVLVADDPRCESIRANRAGYEALRLPMGVNLSKSAPGGAAPSNFRVFRNGVELRPEELPVQRAARGEDVREDEHAVVFDDGTVRFNLGNAVPLRDEQGRVQGAVSAFIDVTERRRAEESLRESDRLHRLIMTLMPAGVYMCEAPSGRITYFNQRAVELWGRKPRLGDDDERFCGSFRLFLPDGTPVSHAPMAQVLQGGSAVREREVVLERPDGTRITVEVNIEPVRDDQGKVVGAINLFQDVTLRRRAQEGQAHWAAIVAGSEDAILSMGLDGTIRSWNPGAQHMYGYSAEEVIGRPITMLMPPGQVDDDLKLLNRLRSGERITHYETQRRRKDGTILDVALTISPVRDGEGRLIGASKIARDITAQKRAQREAARLAAIVASSADAIMAADLEGHLTHWNMGAQRLYGYTAQEIIGRPFSILLPPERSSEFSSTLKRLLNGESVTVPHTVRVRKDGQRVDVAMSACPIHGPGGGIVGVSAIARDITEQKRAEERIRHSERLYRGIGESIDYGIWICQSDGRNIYASPSFLKMTGLTQEQCSDFGWGSILHPDDAEQTIEAWKRCVSDGSFWEREHRMKGSTGSGTIFWPAVFQFGAMTARYCAGRGSIWTLTGLRPRKTRCGSRPARSTY